MKLILFSIHFFWLILFSLSNLSQNNIYNQNISKNDSTYNLFIEKILKEIKNNNYFDAKQLCINKLKDEPNFHDIRLLLAIIHIRTEQFNKAKEELFYITENNKNYYEAWELLGNLSFWENDFKTAINHYDKAINMGFKEDLFYNKARSHFNINEIYEAELLNNRILLENDENTNAIILKDEIILYKAFKEIDNENYTNSIPVINKFIEKYPKNYDTRYRLSQIYYNNEKYDSAKYHLNIIYKNDSTNQDVIMLLHNIALIESEYDKALEYLTILLNFNINDEQLLLRKAQILKKQKEYEEAENSLETIFEDNPKNLGAKNLMHELAPLIYLNTLTASYRFDFFNKDFPIYQLAYLQYSRVFSDNILIARVNRATWYDIIGHQIESDYYRLFESSYLYLNLGVSDKNLFPDIRVGGEYYHTFNKTEISGGLRFLKFDTINVIIYTGSISENINNYLLGYRIYVNHAAKSRTHLTHVLSARRYFNFGNYIGIQYIIGNSPDETHLFDYDTYQLVSHAIRLEFFRKINPFWSFQINLSYINEEFSSNNKRNRYSTEIILNRIF